MFHSNIEFPLLKKHKLSREGGKDFSDLLKNEINPEQKFCFL
jgi:hypothetical protein